MLVVGEDEHPVSIQLFGGEVETMVEAAQYVDTQSQCDIIDINMGCPVNKVLKAHAGSYLMQDPDHAYDIVKGIVDHVSKPVTVKMRIGFDSKHINCVEVAKLMEKAGASAVAIHGRTRSQMYEGKADWSYIKQAKEALSIPVIGNGDVKTPEDAKRMIDETGCDAVMVGRAVLGNPWVLRRMDHYLETGELIDEPDYHEKLNLCRAHAESLMKLKSERQAIPQMRTHAPWYIKGLPSSSPVKAKLSKVSTFKELNEILDWYEDYLDHLD